jgi:O-antigen ligase
MAAMATAYAVAALPAFAGFLGGATEMWSEGVVLALFALLLIVHPPERSAGWLLNTILGSLFLCALLAFLPAHWFAEPAWRSALTRDFATPLPPTLTPQPWLTLDCLAIFSAGMAWVYYAATSDWPLRQVRTQGRIFAGGIIALAALCIALYAAHKAPPFWHNERRFGPFPNRNQTGDLFGITSVIVLACLQDDFRRHKKRWIVWLLGLAVLVAALILDFSRAGILLLILGAVAWLARFAWQKKSAARLAVAASILLVLLTLLLVFGGPTLERFHLRAGSGSALPSDYRWLIFWDAFALIRASPWCGIGLGNFDAIFAIFREVSADSNRALHPESDWLWLCAEMGFPAFVLILAGAAVLVRQVFPLREGSNQRLRYAALIAATLFALHGFVDVSAHRLGTFLAGTFVLGLAVHRPNDTAPSRWVPVLFRMVGIVLFGIGVAWVAGSWKGWPLPGYIGTANAREAAKVANQGHDFSRTVSLTTQGLGWAPLDWQLYFLRALGRNGMPQPPSAALEDFRRARYLEPNAWEVPMEEGKAWLTSRPVLAITAWREALRRARGQRTEVFREMISVATVHSPEVEKALRQLGTEHPDLALAYLGKVLGESFAAEIDAVLALDPELEKFTPEQRAELFALWSERGDAERLDRVVQGHPAWLPLAWRGLAKNYAAKREFQTTVEMSLRFIPAPDFPPEQQPAESIDQLQRKFVADPGNYATGFALCREQMRQNKMDGALETARHFTEKIASPAYFHFLEAECWAEKNRWKEAWEALDAYQRKRR